MSNLIERGYGDLRKLAKSLGVKATGKKAEIVKRIEAAAEMGDVVQIKAIAKNLISDTPSKVPFGDKLIQLAEDFNFDGIQNFMLEADS